MIRSLAVVLLLAVGCQSAFQRDSAYGNASPGRKAKSQAHRTTTMAFVDRLRLAPADAPENIEAEFVCDVQKSDDKVLAQCVDDCLADAYRHMRGEARMGVSAAGVEGVRDAFFADYREWFDENWEAVKSGDMPAYVGEWGCQVEGRVVFCDNRHFSYRVTIDTMTGGPHPNRWVQNATYLRKGGRRLTVTDVIRAESMTPVVNLIRRTLQAQAQDEPLRKQLKGDISLPYDAYVREIRDRKRDEWGNPLVTENFLLTEDGIEWVYNQYEIACYASGVFNVLVKWDVLRAYCTELLRQGSL